MLALDAGSEGDAVAESHSETRMQPPRSRQRCGAHGADVFLTWREGQHA